MLEKGAFDKIPGLPCRLIFRLPRGPLRGVSRRLPLNRFVCDLNCGMFRMILRLRSWFNGFGSNGKICLKCLYSYVESLAQRFLANVGSFRSHSPSWCDMLGRIILRIDSSSRHEKTNHRNIKRRITLTDQFCLEFYLKINQKTCSFEVCIYPE